MKLGDYANIYLSIFSHVETQLTSQSLLVTGTNYGVTLMDAYPDDDQIKKMVFYSDATGASDEIVIPVITIEQSGPIDGEDLELGSLSKELSYPILLTAFLETNIQRLQFETLLDNIVTKNEISYLDYDSDFENPVVSGTILVENYRSIPVQFSNDSPNKLLKWGIDVAFIARRVIE